MWVVYFTPRSLYSRQKIEISSISCFSNTRPLTCLQSDSAICCTRTTVSSWNEHLRLETCTGEYYWSLFYYQLMHITLKNAEVLKYSKLDKNAPTYFGLHRNHLQGAKVSACVKVYLHTVHDTHALQVTICSHSTDDALHIFYADTVNQTCNF